MIIGAALHRSNKPAPSGAADWTDQAACKGMDTETFFAEVEGRSAAARRARDEAVAAAKRACGGCPVRSECLAYGLAHEPYGVWGGADEDERKLMRRRRQRAESMARTRAKAS